MSSASALCELGSAALCDGGARWVAGVVLRSGEPFAGQVRTCWAERGDNLAVQVAVAEASPGEVVVVEVRGGGAEAGVWGEILAVAASVRDLSGVIVDGAVRDVGPCDRRGLGVASASVCPVGPTKTGPGGVGGTISISGVSVRPGDWVVADLDGVAVVPLEKYVAIFEYAHAKAGREPAMLEGLAAGRTTLELFGLDASPIRREAS